MKCYLCDRTLENDEIKHEPEYERGGFSPCGSCLAIIDEIFEPLDEDEIDRQLAFEFYYEGLEDTPSEESS